ncbi:MAG: transcriptional repressor [Vicinamibacteria bacterium]|jgi:Fur family ferric uptake transcriptional regulator|nr:transcriptional repressor [Vicinamibacteria bacterium]
MSADADPVREEREAWNAYIAKNGLKRSEQREAILDVFLRTESHLSVEDLLKLVQKKRPDVGRTTVYRTLKLFAAAGLARELHLDGETRFERDWNREHHDHFICRSCGAIFEFKSDQIEQLQEEIAAEIGFVIDGHRHHIYGLCQRCQAKAKGR